MKRFVQIVSLLLVFSLVLAMPAAAAEAGARASYYFAAFSCYLWKTSSTQFQVWFDVTGTHSMDKLGTSVIKVQRSSDNGSTWSTVKTYNMSDYSSMICENTIRHADCVTYSGASAGYKYRAYVEFYAEDGEGSATYIDYTSAITMP